MGLIDKRKLDDLGRIVLPAEVRKKMDLNAGDTIEILLDEKAAVLKKGQASCIFCQSKTELIDFRGHNVCKECCVKLQGDDTQVTQ